MPLPTSLRVPRRAPDPHRAPTPTPATTPNRAHRAPNTPTTHPPTTITLAVLALAAVALRLLVLHLSGGLRSVAEYDDGVHYGAAALLVHGVLPYRDVVFLQPPGVAVLLSPFALLGRLAGDATGLDAARIATCLVGGITTWYVARLALRQWGATAAVAAAVVYATAAASLLAESTVMLEPYVALLTVLALQQLSRLQDQPVRRPALLAGALLGAAISVKTWALVTAVVALLWLVRTHRRAAWPYAAGVAATTAAICGPFFATAPRAMFHQVVVTQLTRPPDGLAAATARLADITGARTLLHGSPPAVTAVALALAAFLVAAAYVTWRRDRFGRLLVGLLAAGLAMLLAAPVYFTHYGDFLTPFAALVVGAGVSSATTSLRVPAAALLAVVTAVAGQQTLSAATRTTPSAVSAASLRELHARPGCLMAQTPTVAELADMLTRPDCPVWLDARGTALSEDAGRLRAGFYPSGFRQLPRWQAAWVAWAGRASDVVVVGAPCAQPVWAPGVCHFIESRFRFVGTLGSAGAHPPKPIELWVRR